MEVTVHSTEETKRLAGELAERLKAGSVLALYGDLGAGKTTFTNYLVRALGISAPVQSPTFVLMRKYSNKTGNLSESLKSTNVLHVNHIDLYRLSSLAEVEDIGLDEIMAEKDALTIIEWPEIAEPILPETTVKIKFTEKEEEPDVRKITIQNLH